MEAALFYLSNGAAPSTLRVYQSGQRRFERFRSRADVTPSHVLEQLLCLIVADAAKSGLQYSTIKTYLAAVRDFAIANGGRDPFAGSLPTLGNAMLCIKRVQGRPAPDSRRPVTPAILLLLRSAWSPHAECWTAKLM